MAAAPLLGTLACGDNATHPLAHGDYDGGAPTLSCVPNLDQRIDASELGVALGVPVSYVVSPSGVERAVDLAGVDDGSGGRTWNWATDWANDQRVSIQAKPLTGAWYESSFPTGEFAAPLDLAATLDGIYRQDDDGYKLLGIASAVDKPQNGTTLLVYDSPVVVYRLPLAVGDAWVSTGRVTGGTLDGLPYAGTDTYEVKDRAIGRLELPDLGFTQAHEVLLHVTIAPAAGAPRSYRQASFLFECFGEVARATSRADETNELFTTAAELRRLGL